MAKKFDWRALVGTVAPTIATALGGPMAGMATEAIASALGISGSADSLDEQISSRLETATHADLLALKVAGQDFEVQMRELDVREADLYVKDVGNARQAHKDSWEPFVIFCVLTLISATGFWFIVEFAATMGDTTKGMLLPIYGAVVYKWLDSISYFVGTTKDGGRKTSLLALPIK
jgi:hypothetical protein